MTLPYTPYQHFLSRYFTTRVQKLPVDAGMSCPVRDGSKGSDGCAFCNGRSFVPPVCAGNVSVTAQLERGKQFFSRKYRSFQDSCAFLAYFQAGSNTYTEIARADTLFREALRVEGIAGLVISTRPDCLSPAWLDYLAALSAETFVMVELGVESVKDETLRLMGRGHDWQTSVSAIRGLALRHIPVCVHLILGLPGESRSDMLCQAQCLSALPVDVVKLHQLQILRASRWGREYLACPESFSLFTVQEYAELVAEYLQYLRADIAVERFVSQSPKGALIAPQWGLKNDEVTRLVLDHLTETHGYQGKKCFL